jgi:hypothetical protein
LRHRFTNKEERKEVTNMDKNEAKFIFIGWMIGFLSGIILMIPKAYLGW